MPGKINWGANPPWNSIKKHLSDIEANAQWSTTNPDDPNKVPAQTSRGHLNTFLNGGAVDDDDTARKFLRKVAWHVAQVEINRKFGTPPLHSPKQDAPALEWLTNITQNLTAIRNGICGNTKVVADPPDPASALASIDSLLADIAGCIGSPIRNAKSG
jgi:hypothetical protein